MDAEAVAIERDLLARSRYVLSEPGRQWVAVIAASASLLLSKTERFDTGKATQKQIISFDRLSRNLESMVYVAQMRLGDDLTGSLLHGIVTSAALKRAAVPVKLQGKKPAVYAR